jgi:hypothetical protein
MNRNTNTRFVKPMLEELEERAQPSFLSNGLFSTTGPTTIQQNLLPPLQAMFADMQNARNLLQGEFNLLSNPPPGFTIQQAETVYGLGAVDYQRMRNDNSAIAATVAADNNFIRAAAFAEVGEGDPGDAIILFFGPSIGLNPTSSLTNVQTQANALINGMDVQTWVNFNFSTVEPNFTPATWAQVTAMPSF